MFIPPKSFDFLWYKHLSLKRKPFGRVSFFRSLSPEKVRRLPNAIAIFGKKRELSLSPNTQHRQYRIIAQCHFLRRNHSNIHLPTHTIYLLHQNDFRLHTRYA